MLSYENSGASEFVVFRDEVLDVFARHRQVAAQDEAGGQLFAAFNRDTISVESATEPSRWDHRGRCFFIPNRIRERFDIRRMYKRNLHYIGDWHTHAEAVPIPSSKDQQSIAECFERSEKEVGSFLLVIVGTDPFPGGLYVGLHDGTNLRLTRSDAMSGK